MNLSSLLLLLLSLLVSFVGAADTIQGLGVVYATEGECSEKELQFLDKVAAFASGELG